MALNLDKQQTQALAAGAVILVLAAAAYVYFFWAPLSARETDLRAKIADADVKIERAQAEAFRLKHLRDELAALNSEAAAIDRRLPKSKDVPDVLVSLSELASRCGVRLRGFAPGPQKASQYFIELDYPMSVSGSYHDLGRFLAALALQERIFHARDLVLPAPDASGRILATFRLVAYQYKG